LKLREAKRDKERLRKKEIAQQGVTVSTSSKLVIRATDISKSFGSRQLIKPFCIEIEKGDRLGIIGPNGAGKTTLAQILVKKTPPDQGKVYLGPKTELIYFDQMRDSLDPNKSLWQNLTDGNYVNVQGQDIHVMGYLKGFMFNHEQVRGIVGILSGGEKNRLALAKALCQKGNLLVLDEPTNDLDMDTLDMLQELLSDYPGTLIVISHDRDFLDRLTTSVLVMDGSGRVEEFIGGYSETVKRPIRAIKSVISDKSRRDAEPGSQATNPLLIKDEKKTSFKHKHAFEQMSQQVTTLENKIQDLEYQLEEAELFTKNPEKFQKLSADLVASQKALVAAEEEWFALAELF
jgi:ATP-binding cassette subfamily F protein uup